MKKKMCSYLLTKSIYCPVFNVFFNIITSQDNLYYEDQLLIMDETELFSNLIPMSVIQYRLSDGQGISQLTLVSFVV